MEHQPADYLECFERAFEEPFGRIPFGSMDFQDVQPRLMRLADYLTTYYQTVEYPRAKSDEVVPYLVSQRVNTKSQILDPSRKVIRAPFWDGDLRRVLLFAHKVVFEDPIHEALSLIAGNLDPKIISMFEEHYGEPVQFPPDYLNFLRRAFLSLQQMEVLVRRGIVIPHAFLLNRYPGFENRFEDADLFYDQCVPTAGMIVSQFVV